MPLYDFKCEAGHRFERIVKLADFDSSQHCACSLPARRVISAPMISVENVGYDCPITGKWIGSKRDHKDNLHRHDCRVYESGETESQVRTREREEAAFEATIDRAVEKAVEALPGDKRDQLAKELSTNDLSVVRGTAP